MLRRRIARREVARVWNQAPAVWFPTTNRHAAKLRISRAAAGSLRTEAGQELGKPLRHTARLV
jgi:hypothetical protein